MRTTSAEKVDVCAADFPVGFSTASAAGRLYVAYYNAGHDITVASRQSEGAPWIRKVLPSRANWDSHRSIVLAIDRDGHLHVSGNMHADPMVYFRTSEPLDIETFENFTPLVNAEEEKRATYPRFLTDARGDLIYLYRLGGSGNGITIVNRYRADTGSFERVSESPLFDGLNEMSAYQSGPVLGPDGRYHLVWVWRNTPHCETNHDLSYAVSDDLVHWRPFAGDACNPPITPRTAQFVVDPVPPGGGIINGGHTLTFDPSDDPVITYHKYDADGNSQVHVARPTSGRWQSTQVSEWGHRWDFSGSGSIENEIRLGRPTFTEGKLTIPYWQLKRGDGELDLDAASLELIEDRKVEPTRSKPYPSELCVPKSELAGMSVQWLPASTATAADASMTAFRWEAGGKRRRYDPPDPPIPPPT